MIHKGWIFWGIMFCLFFLTGCNETFEYDPDLFKPDQNSCWPCQMYMSAFNAFSSALEGSLSLICSNCFKVMTISLAFWLLYKVVPWVVSLSPPNFKEDFSLITKVLFKAMVIGLLLANPDYFYDQIGNKVLQPAGTVFLKISELVLASPNSLGIETSQYAKSQNTFLTGLTSMFDTLKGTGSSMADKISAWYSDSWVSDLFPKMESAFSETKLPNGEVIKLKTDDRMFGQLPTQITNVIWQIYSELWSGMGLVFQLIRSDYFSAFLAALFLAFILCDLMIFLPLSFIDAFMRMGIGVLLMPIFLTIWIFPIKMFEGMAKKMIELILSAFFDILFNCIYVAFLISVIRVYVQDRFPNIFSTDYQASESRLREAGLHLSMDFVVMLVLIWTIYKLSKRVDEITSQFFDSAGQGTSIRATIKQTLKTAAYTALAVGRVVISGGTDWTGFKKAGQEAAKLAGYGMADMNSGQTKDFWKNDINDEADGNMDKALEKHGAKRKKKKEEEKKEGEE